MKLYPSAITGCYLAAQTGCLAAHAYFDSIGVGTVAVNVVALPLIALGIHRRVVWVCVLAAVFAALALVNAFNYEGSSEVRWACTAGQLLTITLLIWWIRRGRTESRSYGPNAPSN